MSVHVALRLAVRISATGTDFPADQSPAFERESTSLMGTVFSAVPDVHRADTEPRVTRAVTSTRAVSASCT